MLNMSSVPIPSPPAAATTPALDPDRTARARIRDAAIDRFGQDGIAATSLRTIAADAGVSAALVVHHFGSKDGLREACDDHVAATIRDGKHAAMAAGPQIDALAALRQAEQTQPLLRYLARVLVDPSPRVAALVDELVDDAEAYMAEGVRTGMLRPSADPRGRAVVLTMWSLGALVLHEHVARLLGADLITETHGLVAYSLPATELLGEGALTPEVYERIRAAYADIASPGGHHQEQRP
jgi:AcrR family transcriptional regulator